MGCLQSKSTKTETFDYSTGSAQSAGIILESTTPYVPPSYHATNPAQKNSTITDSEAIILASNYCKDSPFQWQDEALVKIGNKPLKWHFLVRGKDTEISKITSMILTLTLLIDSPISLANTTTKEVFGNLLCALSHPYLLPCEDVEYLKDKQVLITVRKYIEKGSLKDLIYGKQNPKDKATVKYRRENCRPLRPRVIRTFGRHILEALSALNAKGIICDSLKASNIMVDNGVARISELETTFLGSGMSEEMCDMILEYELGNEGKICPIDVILFGLLLLEMISGHPVYPANFQNEIQNEFYDRFASLNPTPENDSLRDILSSIFIRCEATVESLLGHAFFQSVELTHAPQRIKLQSVEKGFVKNSMAKGEEFRAKRREILLKRDQTIKEEKEKQAKELVEAEEADDIVTRRRNKSLRRASTGSTGGGGSLRRRSVQSGAQNPQAAMTKDSSGDVLSNTSSPLYSDSSPPPPAPVPTSDPSSSSSPTSHTATTSTSSSSTIPPQYQKLLNIGLSQDVVKHKMLSDGFDPATVGW